MSLPVPWLDRLAHDLRGPLTPLQTAAYLLKSGHVDAALQQELFTLIERQTRVMGSMIDELSDWSQANRGLLLGRMEPCEVSLLLDMAFSGFSPVTGTMPTIVDESEGANVIADQIRLVEVFRTLVGYASSRAADVAASVHVRRIDDRLRMEIVAPGHAADVTEVAALFQHPLPEPYDSGLGLKLLIARAIVVAHTGSLTAEASLTGGLRIYCDLPLVAPAAE
ncbi:MAG: HAMP domain-containing histidine kinase [Lysobacter sp.]|nr:HAMP domain-containing histidine kinase [Lysobacter sp.]